MFVRKELLKILHVVFCSFILIFLICGFETAQDSGPAPDWTHNPGYFSSEVRNESDGSQPKPSASNYVFELRAHWSVCLWTIVTILVLMCGIALLVSFIFKDPTIYKKWLLAYYIVAAIFALLGFIFSVFYFLHMVKFYYCAIINEAGDRVPLDKSMPEPLQCSIATNVFFWMFILANIFNIATLATYIASVVFWIKGQP